MKYEGRHRLWPVLAILSGLSAPAAWSQEEQVPIIRARVEMVNVVLTVRDKDGNYVSDLKKEDFQVWEERIPQEIQFFAQETGPDAQPLTMVLLLDTSGSIKENLSFVQEAATQFLKETLRKNKDMAAVIQFDSEINLVQDFTYDYQVLEHSIFNIQAGGATKLYDAIWVAVEDLLKPEVGRKLMVVISDGADTQSMVSDQEAIEMAQNEDVVIYGIGVRSRRFDSDFGKLKKFAQSTGGRFFDSRLRPDELERAFRLINREIKNQYSLGYYSTNPNRDGSFRKIEVQIKRSGLKVHHREGYYAN